MRAAKCLSGILGFGPMMVLSAETAPVLTVAPVKAGSSTKSVNTYGEFSSGAVFSESTSGGAVRPSLRLELGALDSFVAIQGRIGVGDDHTDYGAIFKLFKHFRFDRGWGLSAGLGAGVLAADGHRLGRVPPYVEYPLIPYVRGLYDFGNQFGVDLTVEYERVLSRTYKYEIWKRASSINTDTKDRVRWGFLVGFLFSI